MAPVITITIKGGLIQHHAPTQIPIQTAPKAPAAYKPCKTPMKVLGPYQGTASLSAISWAVDRTDVFGQNPETGAISHKWWDGYQWNPSGSNLEDLGAEAAAAPVAITWGKDHMDLFSRGFEGELAHKYWDGTAWKPDETSSESLGGGLDIDHSQLAVTSWGEGRLDVFAIGANDSALLHKYWDGSQWNPSEGMENLGNELAGGVTAVSWNTSRLDVFATDKQGHLMHIYYDGKGWSDWEDMLAPFPLSEPTVSSWGPNRLDLFGVSLDQGHLWHTAWDGTNWLAWEDLGGTDLIGPVAAGSWGADRIDIVALGTDSSYYYKYWDGHQWNPTDNTLYPKGGKFSSVPTLSSWGVNRLDIFGVTDDAQLGHQTWYGSGWYPEWEFEKLGGDLAVDSVNSMKVHKEL